MKNNKSNKAVIYARTAKTDESKESASIAGQIEQCMEYAKKNGFVVDKVFADRGISGFTPLEKREELKKAVLHCDDNNINIIIVSKPERIARGHIEYIQIIGALEKRGINVLPKQDSKNIIMQIACATDYISKVEISERIKRGIKAKKRANLK